MAKQQLDIHVGVTDGASGPLEALAAKARQLRKDDALSGEKALGGFLSRGSGGVADLGLSALGYGAAGLGLDFAGKSLASILGNIEAVQAGEKTVGDVLETFARGLPVIGAFGEVFEKMLEVAGGSMDRFNKDADARSAAIIAANNQHIESTQNAESLLKGAQRQSISSVGGFGAMRALENFDFENNKAMEGLVTRAITLAQQNTHPGPSASLDDVTANMSLKDRLMLRFGNAVGIVPNSFKGKDKPGMSEEDKRDLLKNDEAIEGLRKAHQERMAAIDKAEEAASRERLVAVYNLRQKLQSDATDSLSQSLSDRLRAQGKTLEADTEDIHRNLAEKLRAINESALSAIGSGVDVGTATSMAGVQAAAAASSAASATLTAKAQNEMRQVQLQIDQLEQEGDKGVSLSRRFSPSEDARFLSGVGDALLAKTAAVDTSRNTKQMLAVLQDQLKWFQLKFAAGGAEAVFNGSPK